jgi:hypothetical protein
VAAAVAATAPPVALGRGGSVDVGVAVGVWVAVGVGVIVGVDVGAGVGVTVAVMVAVGVAVKVGMAVFVGARRAAGLGNGVAVGGITVGGITVGGGCTGSTNRLTASRKIMLFGTARLWSTLTNTVIVGACATALTSTLTSGGG